MRKSVICGFPRVGRTMDAIPLSDPWIWATVAIGAIVFGILSVAISYQTAQTEEEQFNKKALIRDTLLGAIFTGIAWIVLPDSMKSLTSSLSSTAQKGISLPSIPQMGGSESVVPPSLGGDMDLQVGPPSF